MVKFHVERRNLVYNLAIGKRTPWSSANTCTSALIPIPDGQLIHQQQVSFCFLAHAVMGLRDPNDLANVFDNDTVFGSKAESSCKSFKDQVGAIEAQAVGMNCRQLAWSWPSHTDGFEKILQWPTVVSRISLIALLDVWATD